MSCGGILIGRSPQVRTRWMLPSRIRLPLLRPTSCAPRKDPGPRITHARSCTGPVSRLALVTTLALQRERSPPRLAPVGSSAGPSAQHVHVLKVLSSCSSPGRDTALNSRMHT